MRRLLHTSRSAATRRIAIAGLAILVGFGPAYAQSGEPHPQDQTQKPAAPNGSDAAKDAPHKVNEYVEAAQAINGPAGNPECVRIGRNAVNLIWRDDMDTAFRHLDLYDRFGCPGGHIQAALRCLTRFADTIDDLKQTAILAKTVHMCWINPNAQPQPAAAPSPAAAASPAAAPAAAATK
jgi:hypothetical protein